MLETPAPTLSMISTWLAPTLSAVFLYGVGQGLLKKYSSKIPAASFCLYLLVTKAVINGFFFLFSPHPAFLAAESRAFIEIGFLAFVLDGFAWILYFHAIAAGPISIVGTFSAAYPALTVFLAWMYLGETLSPGQYLGVVTVITGCIAVSYAPSRPDTRTRKRVWVPLASMTFLLWGTSQALIKYAYLQPNANEANMALASVLGTAGPLGAYAWLARRRHAGSAELRALSFLPMAMMAGGELAMIFACKLGPISIVTPMSGTYPVVTLIFASVVLRERITPFQWTCVWVILAGMAMSMLGNGGW